MAGYRWSPTVVVGIDFGMTCTGVAYSSEFSGWARPEVIQQWPHHKPVLFSKYPSRIAYDEDGEVIDWGTCTMAVGQPISLAKEFKLFLDPTYSGPSRHGIFHEQAIIHYVNYMRALYHHVDDTLNQRIPRWEEQNVEYRFSIPTTWKNPRLTNQLKAWLADAGFISTSNRAIVFSRTEAEAAAVYVAKDNQVRAGDIVMVVDAGGATTDLNILEVIEQGPEVTRLQGLDKAEGINVGSVMIDTAARTMVEQKLRAMQVYAEAGLTWLAESLMEENDFQLFKCSYGKGDGLLDFHMEIPGRTVQHVVLRSSEIDAIFDVLVNELIQSIRDKISSLTRSHPRHELRSIILSGGLGSSKYVERKLREEFSTSSMLSGGNSLQVLVTADPQLAVVRGLVIDIAQTIAENVPIWGPRCCRVSYGILCRYPYDSDIHVGEPTMKDPLTGKIWVEDQIDWIIKEGEIVPEEGVIRSYSLEMTNGKQIEPFHANIVMSELPASSLPRSKHRGGVTKICTVQGTFLPDDFAVGDYRKGRRSIFGRQKEHDVANFNLKILVGSTDLEFEFVSLDGRSYSQKTKKVQVIWEDYRTGPEHSAAH